MSTGELMSKFNALYNTMASSSTISHMQTFGTVLKVMMVWMIQEKPEAAQEWIERLESINWDNYLTKKEAVKIVENMKPKAPWPMDQWASAIKQKGYETENKPCYNGCALWVTMNMIMSDSGQTLSKYVGNSELFSIVHSLAVDKLTDADKMFSIRKYFNV
jgi:hypothetical protein